MVARLVWDEEAPGSSPGTPTYNIIIKYMKESKERETLLDHLGAERLSELVSTVVYGGGVAEITRLLSIRVNKWEFNVEESSDKSSNT